MNQSTQKMPALFIGHGSPMNAIASNDYTQTLNALGNKLPTPKAILCVSAHWLTEGTWVTHMKQPKTIHDFYGFPKELFDVRYAAPGAPEMAELVKAQTSIPEIGLDDSQWGFDHGTWSVLRHLYPEANIPVIQLSIDYHKPGEYHLELGEKLRKLRNEGVMIVGSGNIVHNLRKIEWDTDAKPYDWAIEYDEWVKAKLLDRDFKSLSTHYADSTVGKLAVPTPDHYYPLLYTLGASEPGEEMTFDYEAIQNGSIAMRSVRFG